MVTFVSNLSKDGAKLLCYRFTVSVYNIYLHCFYQGGSFVVQYYNSEHRNNVFILSLFTYSYLLSPIPISCPPSVNFVYFPFSFPLFSPDSLASSLLLHLPFILALFPLSDPLSSFHRLLSVQTTLQHQRCFFRLGHLYMYTQLPGLLLYTLISRKG